MHRLRSFYCAAGSRKAATMQQCRLPTSLAVLLQCFALSAVQGNSMFQGCNIDANWFPECWVCDSVRAWTAPDVSCCYWREVNVVSWAQHSAESLGHLYNANTQVSAHARISFGGDRVLYWIPYTSLRWGNALSPYWQARALALLAGMGFDSYGGFEHGWMHHLPRKLPPSTCPQLDKFNQACDLCDSESWAYTHRCHGAWVYIRPTIITDTHAAMSIWRQSSSVQPPEFQLGDTVIQSRCSKDTLLSHPEYGPVAFSFYDNIAPTAENIYIVAEQGLTFPACEAIRAAKVAWLQARYPDSKVHIVGGSLEQDFARLMYAPVLFKDAQSSFGLWAALANKNEVWSVPMLQRYTNNTMPDFGKQWHWVHTPVLYPHVAAAANISHGDTKAIIEWLQDH